MVRLLRSELDALRRRGQGLVLGHDIGRSKCVRYEQMLCNTEANAVTALAQCQSAVTELMRAYEQFPT